MSLYFKPFQDYIKSLCAKHVDLQHGVDGKHAFSRMESEDEINKLKTSAAKYGVVVGSFFGRAKGSVDQGKLALYASLLFTGKVKAGTGKPADEIELVLQKTFDIMMDFYARIIEDMLEDDCGPLQGLRAEEMAFDPIEEQPIIEYHFGWEMTIPFDAKRPAFNPAKWISDD